MVVDSRNIWNNVGVCIAAQTESSFVVLQAYFYELFRCVIADGGSVCYNLTNSRKISNYSAIAPLENHRGLMNMLAKNKTNRSTTKLCLLELPPEEKKRNGMIT